MGQPLPESTGSHVDVAETAKPAMPEPDAPVSNELALTATIQIHAAWPSALGTWLLMIAIVAIERRDVEACAMIALAAVTSMARRKLAVKAIAIGTHTASPELARLLHEVTASLLPAGLIPAIALANVFTVDDADLRFALAVLVCGSAAVASPCLVLVKHVLPLFFAPQLLAMAWMLWKQGRPALVLSLAMILFAAIVVRSATQRRNGLARAVANANKSNRIACELMLAKNKADSDSLAKSRFLAVMSHEIRTPMNGMLGALSVLNGTQLDTAQREWVDIVSKSGESLLRLLNQVLDYSQIEAEKLHLVDASIDLHSLLKEGIQLFKASAANKGLKLELELSRELPDCIVGDPLRLRQVLLNLIGNAVKFTDQGHVKVKACIKTVLADAEVGADRSGPARRLVIEVRDTGQGIPVEATSRLFEAFYQVQTSDHQRRGGTGLGLSICRVLVEAMGGRLTVQSEVGRGSTFSFNIPFVVCVGQSTIEPPESQTATGRTSDFLDGGLTGVKILLVEDNPVNRTIATAVLQDFGADVSVAEDGVEAVVARRTHMPHVVLMDCQMPNMDGYEAARAIREWESSTRTPWVPIIALTANDLRDESDRCTASGMDGHLAKPYTRQDLLKTLSKWIVRSQVA